MITYRQQVKIIYNIFKSFETGEIKDHFMPNDYNQFTKFLYNHSKFESMTIPYFKLILIYTNYYFSTTSIKDLLETISDFTKSDLIGVKQLKEDVKSYNYIIRTDLSKIEESTLNYFTLLQRKEIHPFTFAWYYKRHPEELESFGRHEKRIIEKYYKRARVLTDYFKLDSDD